MLVDVAQILRSPHARRSRVGAGVDARELEVDQPGAPVGEDQDVGLFVQVVVANPGRVEFTHQIP